MKSATGLTRAASSDYLIFIPILNPPCKSYVHPIE